MGLKILIIVLFIGMVISLFTGLTFMVKDKGSKTRQRTALGFRLFFGISLIAAVYYGVGNGTLQFGAPWDKHKHQAVEAPAE